MSDLRGEFLTTSELADLLRIKERKVYDLASTGEVPCSRATGKLLFPRQGVEAWLLRNSSGVQPERRAICADVFAGSHDPLLAWALSEARTGLATYFDGSLDGVERFASGQAVAAGLHVYDPGTEGWNEQVVADRFERAPVVLVEFAWRERGLIVTPNVEDEIVDISSLRGRRVVPRQPEAGSQALLDHLLGVAGLDAGDLELISPARNETDAALAVAEGKAEAAFGLLGLARQFRLGFVPLMRERFDLLVDRRAWFEPPLQALIGFCRSDAFRLRACELQGYDVGGFGRVHFNGP